MKTHLSWSIVLATSLLSLPAAAQVPTSAANRSATPSKALTFDAATIKPIAPDGRATKGWIGMRNRPDGVEAASQTLPELLCYAYGYKSLRFDGQVTGVPDWAVSQKYDIEAKMSAADTEEFKKLGSDAQEQWREAMLQSLLAERFHLTLHRGSKQIPVYELVVAKEGSKMKDAATDPGPLELGKGDDGKPNTGIRFLKDTSVVQAYSMGSLADLLSLPAAQVGRPVLDKTGLTGTYDFKLDWSIYSAAAAAGMTNGAADGDSVNDATTIFAALGRIGLKLQPSTGSMETIIIDHVERPTEN